MIVQMPKNLAERKDAIEFEDEVLFCFVEIRSR